MPLPAPMPLFDRLSRIAENHYPQLVPILKRAKLFIFDAAPHEVLPQSVPVEESSLLLDNFFLPFDAIAIEDRATCTVLLDLKEDQSGFGDDRMFIDLCPMFADSSVFSDSEEMKAAQRKVDAELKAAGTPKDGSMITIGRFDKIWPDTTDPNVLNISGSVDLMFLASKQKLLSKVMSNIKDKQLIAPALRHAKTAVEEVLYFNSPSRFVCERKPHKKAKTPKPHSAKVPRSNEQSVFTILTPKEITDKLGLVENQALADGTTTGRKKSAHWRRKHQRLLTSDRYTSMKNKTITVKASWIGPEVAERKGHVWKIRIDL